MTTINQDKTVFKEWLKALPADSYCIAGDPCHCWLAEWFTVQGVYVWGVFPEHYRERTTDAPGGASQEILLDDPEAKDFDPNDRIKLEEWACKFAKEVDRLYHNPMQYSTVTRAQALEALETISE